jgi:hypothetical protein
MKLAEQFRAEALQAIDDRVARLRGAHTFESVNALPEAQFEDVVIAGREVQLTVFRQSNVPMLDGRVLVTVQIARHGLGGVKSFRVEKGLVFSAGEAVREATTRELEYSGS